MLAVSIILVNWNAGPVLAACIDKALAELESVAGECIIVDNGSAAADLDLLRDKFPHLQVIANSRNLGFAKAINQGIQRSHGRYLLLLNPDAFLSPGSLRSLVAYLDAESEVGIVGPRIINPDGSVQGSARAFPRFATAIFGRTSLLTRLFPQNRFTGRQLPALNADSDRSEAVEWVSGACMFIRRQVLEGVGLLDERFFLYWEDADFCWRAREKGWRVVYHPQVSVIHLIGVCSQRAPVASLMAFHRSAYRFYRLHVTRSTFHPLNLVAATGLVIHFASVLAGRVLRRIVRAAVGTRSPLPNPNEIPAAMFKQTTPQPSAD